MADVRLAGIEFRQKEVIKRESAAQPIKKKPRDEELTVGNWTARAANGGHVSLLRIPEINLSVRHFHQYATGV